MKSKSAYCPHCKDQVLAQGERPNHVLHVILSFLTLGLWLPIWFIIVIAKAGNYRCVHCGQPV